jgi:outer membrane protein TolC
MNRREVFAAVVPPAAGFAALVATAAPYRSLAGEPAKTKLDELLKERLAVLREIAKQVAAEYRIGKAPFDRVHHAQMAVLTARLESSESDKDRLAILEETLALAKENEKTATQLYETGRAPASDPLTAKAGRLEVEIALERARAKGPARPK